MVLHVAGIVQRGHLGVLEGDELAVALVQPVREPTVVALAGKRDARLYPMAVADADDALTAEVHVRAMLGARLRPASLGSGTRVEARR